LVTTFDPMSPLPPITTIFIFFLPFLFDRGFRPAGRILRGSQVLEPSRQRSY
jgi:hypothetical protein